MGFKPHGPRCRECGAPTATPHFAPVDARCLACDEITAVTLPTHGGVRQVELGIAALFKQGAWLDALRRRDAEQLVIADRCACAGPLVVSADRPLGGRCEHCQLEQEWSVGEHVVDALPASKVSGTTWGGGLTLRFSPSLIEAAVDQASPCPGCGAPLPAFRGVHQCQHCRRTLHAMLSCGHRFLVGFEVEGDDEGRSVAGWVPIGEAVEAYAARKELASRGTWSTLRAIGAWFLLVPAFPLCACPLFLSVGVVTEWLPEEHRWLALPGMLGVMALMGAAAVGALTWMFVSRIRANRRDREELLGRFAPLPRRGIRSEG